jgi:hypothetical protein
LTTTPLPLPHHLRQLVLHANESAAQVDFEDAVPLIQLDLGNRCCLVLDAGIVERDASCGTAGRWS